LATEGDGGVAADIEPVSPLEDGVALVVSHVKRAGIDDDFQASAMLLDVIFKGAVRAVELAALGEKPEMIDFKLRDGAAGINLVRFSTNRGA